MLILIISGVILFILLLYNTHVALGGRKIIEKPVSKEIDKTIEVISSKTDNYYIKQHVCGKFYAEVRTRSWWKLQKEYYHDRIGLTYKHPVHMGYYSCIESTRWAIGIHIKLDEEE